MKTNIVIDILHQSHILQDSSSQVMAKMLMANRISGFFKM